MGHEMIVGWANGCFDGLHAGHRYFLRECRKHCDRLLIGLNRDQAIRKAKGKDRPLNPWRKRRDALVDCGLTNGVYAIMHDPKAMIANIRPDIVFRGWDQDVEPWLTAPVIRIPRIGNFSTTNEIEARNGLCDRQ